jgi:DNA-directed RNA polymerase specialized sigma24 family protein
VLGTDFARTMRTAQAGEEDAFVRLWRDANPVMVRYLRVVGHDDPYDEACEGWVTVVRGLPGFTGDETDWRVWVLACARQRAEESTLRRTWGAVTGYEGFQVEGDGEIDLEEVLEPEDAEDPTHRGISETLAALRGLPLGQGEVVVLRLGAELPTGAVATVVGIDEDSVERAEARALERLGVGAELVSWSLAAPPMRAELADENVAVGAFRAVLARVRADKVKVVAIGTGSRRSSSRQAAARQTYPSLVLVDSRSTSRGASRSPKGSVSTDRWAPSTVDTRNRAGARGAKVAGRSRTAALTVTALSLSLASIGGFSAAAYVGVLPAPVQQVMHDAVGAPAPGARDAGSSSTRRQPVTSPTAGIGPAATNRAAAGLCRAWSTDKAKGTARDRSVAFQSLSSAAGGPDKVSAYCATALASQPSHGAPTASVGTKPATPGPGRGTGKPTDKGTGSPTDKGTGKPTDRGTGKPAGTTSTKASSGTHTPQGNPATPAKPTASPKGQPTSQATPGHASPTSKGHTSGSGTGNGNSQGSPSGG